MALQGPFDGPGPLMVGYLEKLSSGLVKVSYFVTR